MHTFFHGWRRKAGGATLVMALALVLADATFGPAPWGVHWHHSDPVSHEWNGIGMSTQSSGVGIAVPNWSIAIPLTLLSAYLILVPSRKRPPTASQPHA